MRKFLFKGQADRADRVAWPFAKLRHEVFEASIPGAQSLNMSGELAIISNGYVAYSTIVESVAGEMTNPRLTSEIRVVPGSLRLTDKKGNPSDEHSGHFARLLEQDIPNVPASRLIRAQYTPVQGFGPGGTYRGFQLLSDPNQTGIEHLVTSSHDSDKTLLLATRLVLKVKSENHSTSLIIPGTTDKLTSTPVPVSWEDSIEAIAFARHVTEWDVLPEQIRKLSKLWRDRGDLGENRLLWTAPGYHAIFGQPDPESPRRRYISMTASNEQLRFFEAGYLSLGRQLYVRHKPDLEQCLKEAFAGSEDEPDWAIIA